MIKRNNMKMTVMSVVVGMTLLTGCSSQTATNGTSSNQTSTVEGSTNENLNTEITVQASDISVEYAEDDYYTNWNNETVTKVVLNGNSISVEGTDAVVDGTTLKISNAGTYVVSGNLADGQIVVESSDKETVRIVLNGAELTCSTGAPIYVKSAEKVVLSLEANTVNKITDASNYILEEGRDEPDATIFSKDDLTINGTGTLTIEANYNNAITSKDELKIMEGIFNITATGDGIKGKDMVAIKGGDILINAVEDGIKATNATDATKGFVYIEGGNIDITAGNDGIQAETDLKVLGGNLVLNTGGGSSNGESHTEEFFGGKGGFGMTKPENEGMTPPADEGMAKPENKGMTRPENEGVTAPTGEGVTAPGDMPETKTNNMADTTITDSTTEETVSDSYKGLKATNCITIEGGTFTIDSADDALHSDNSIIINDGELVLSAGDDGIHAESMLVINGGTTSINKSYEGLEAADITINDGIVYITSSDDGVNATDGTSTTVMGGMNGNTSSSVKLTINGGYLNVDAGGDGLDSNGSIYMTDGTVIINGPTNGGNGALDYDASFEVGGGVIIAAGSSQMAQNPSSTSSQKVVSITFTNYQEAGTNVALLDETGEVVVSFTPNKTYQSVIISSPLLEEGKTYTFAYGGTISESGIDGLYQQGQYSNGVKVTEFTISDEITYLNESGVTTGNGSFGQGGGRKPSGGRGNRVNDGTTATVPDSKAQNAQNESTSANEAV